MRVHFEDLENLKKKITVTIPKEKVKFYYDRELKDLQSGSNLKGFRPGKTPRNFLIKKYNRTIQARAAEKLINETFPEAVKEHEKSIAYYYPADHQSEKLSASEDFKYELEFDVYSDQINLDIYKKLDVKKEPVEVTADEVDHELLLIFEKDADKTGCEREIQKGDFVKVEIREPESDEKKDTEENASSDDSPENEGEDKEKQAADKKPEETIIRVGYDNRLENEFDKIEEKLIGKKNGDEFESGLKNPPEGNSGEQKYRFKILETYTLQLPEEKISLEEVQKFFPGAKEPSEARKFIEDAIRNKKEEDNRHLQRASAREQLEGLLDFEVSDALVESSMTENQKQDKEKYEEHRAQVLKNIRVIQFFNKWMDANPIEGINERFEQKLHSLGQGYPQFWDLIRNNRDLRMNFYNQHFSEEVLNSILSKIFEDAPDKPEKEEPAENPAESS